MKRNRMILWLLAFTFTFIFYGMASGDGGGWAPQPGCETLPEPTAGPFLNGFFIAAYDSSQCTLANPDCRHYNIHVMLEQEAQGDGGGKHLFSFHMVLSNLDICSFTDAELKEKYKFMPCGLKAGEAFDLPGVPVITELSVIKNDNCCDSKKGMLYGTLKIRVVPVP